MSLPNYASNYYATTGSYSFSAYGYTVTGDFKSLNQTYTTYFPDPKPARTTSASYLLGRLVEIDVIAYIGER